MAIATSEVQPLKPQCPILVIEGVGILIVLSEEQFLNALSSISETVRGIMIDRILKAFCLLKRHLIVLINLSYAICFLLRCLLALPIMMIRYKCCTWMYYCCEMIVMYKYYSKYVNSSNSFPCLDFGFIL